MSDRELLIGESIDRLITVEVEARPGESQGAIQALYTAAREQAGQPLALAAARALCERIQPGDTVVVSSGWVIDYWFPRGELCGMIGASALARFFSKAMGARVLFPTEEEVLPVFEAICRSVGVRVFDYAAFRDLTRPVVGSMAFPVNTAEAERCADQILSELAPKAVITVEKCGRNVKGVYHTGQGNDMSSTTAKVDLLVERARANGVLTVGIGDLGNEIGFGNIRSTVERVLATGRQCKCPCEAGMAADVSTDYLVVASASNRGGYGVEAALALLTGRDDLMHTGEMERSMIAAASAAGAIDSFTVSPTQTDGHGVHMDISAGLVDLLGQVVRSKRTEFPLFAARA